jgi:hypothetical protein
MCGLWGGVVEEGKRRGASRGGWRLRGGERRAKARGGIDKGMDMGMK